MAIERLFLPFQKTDRRQSRAGTLDGLFEKGWQQNRRRVRERATEEAQADETKRKELDNTVDEQHDLQQGKTEKIQEQEPGLEKDRQEPKEDRGQEEEQEQVRKNEQEKKQEKQKQKYEQDQEQVQVQEQEQEEEQKKSKKAKKVKKVSPRKSKHRRQQPPEQVPPPLDYKDFIHALTRWSSIRQSPNQVVQEVDSLLSLLSPSITCQTGCYVAVNVSSLPKNRLVFVQVNPVHTPVHLSSLTQFLYITIIILFFEIGNGFGMKRLIVKVHVNMFYFDCQNHFFPRIQSHRFVIFFFFF